MTDFNLTGFLTKAVNLNASDIHLKQDEYPVLRKAGNLFKIDMPKLTKNDMQNIIKEIIPDKNINIEDIFDLDFSYEIQGLSRFRVNLAKELNKFSLVLRTIPYNAKSFEELHLPTQISQFTKLKNGLILITGNTGSGKSTTLNSIIDFINKNYDKNIITIEDPIEFIFESKKSIFSQRQVGIDTPSFNDGIKYALRQDPDIICISEIRDIETLTNAMKAAETGHLVFSTLHTNDAIQSINRIINMYDSQFRDNIRKQLSDILRGTISQKLLRTKEGGYHPACEILVVTPTIKDFILKDELDKIYELMTEGEYNGMITMNKSLYELVQKKFITEDEALEVSNSPSELQLMLKGAYHGMN